MPKKIILMRHGDYNCYGSPNLTERGQCQSQSIAEQLIKTGNIGAILHSPLPRARETAEILHKAFQQARGESVPLSEANWLNCGYPYDHQFKKMDPDLPLVIAVTHAPNIKKIAEVFDFASNLRLAEAILCAKNGQTWCYENSFIPKV